MKIVKALIFSCSLLVSSSSYAAGYLMDGSQLVMLARHFKLGMDHSRSTNFQSAGEYMGYIKGVYDTLSLTHVVCAPSNQTTGQIGVIVLQYLDEHPERWHEPAYFLVRDALVKPFPCSK